MKVTPILVIFLLSISFTSAFWLPKQAPPPTVISSGNFTDTDTWWPLVTKWLYNNSGSLDFNETLLNLTINVLDNDTLSTIACGNGQVIKYNVTTGTWICADDYIGANATDTDTWWPLVTKWLFNNSNFLDFNETLLNQTINALDDDTLGDLLCSAGEIPKYIGGNWVCSSDIDTQKDTSGPYLSNDSNTIFFNESYLNGTINNKQIWQRIGNNITLKNEPGNVHINGNLTVLGSGYFTKDVYVNQSSIKFVAGDGSLGNLSRDNNQILYWNGQPFLFGIFVNASDGKYLYIINHTIYFNESYLNNTIEFLDTDTQKNASGPYLYNDSATVYFNETKLNETIDNKMLSIVYIPTSYQVLTGTATSGNLTSIQVVDEGKSLNISEAAGANPLTVIINFTGVEDINLILLRTWYAGSAAHQIAIGLYDWNTSTYEEEYGNINTQTEFLIVTANVYDSTSHISAGKVSLRLRHIQTGITSHRLRIDYAALIKGTSTIVTSRHDSLSGRDLENNHLWAFPTSASRNITGHTYIQNSLTVTGNISSTYYFGSGRFLTDLPDKKAQGPYLYNNTNTIFFNESYLNTTIINIAEVKQYEYNLTVVVAGGVGISTSIPVIDYEITRITVYPPSTPAIYRFEMNETSTNTRIDVDRIPHLNTWDIYKTHTLNDTVTAKIRSATVDGNYIVRIRYLDNGY